MTVTITPKFDKLTITMLLPNLGVMVTVTEIRSRELRHDGARRSL